MMYKLLSAIALAAVLAAGAGASQVIEGGFHEHALAALGEESWAVAQGKVAEVFSLSSLEHPVLTLRGPAWPIWSLAASPGRKYLAAGDKSGIVTVWDLATGEVVYSLRGHKFGIWALAFSPDGTILASGSHDSTIKLWDMATGLEVGVLQGHRSWVRCVSFSPEGAYLASSSCDGTVRIWNPATLRQLTSIKAGADGIYSLSFSPDGRLLAWGNYEGEIRLYRASDWQEERVFGPRNHQSLYAIAFSPDGERIACGGFARRLQIWDVADGSLISEYKGHRAQIWGVAFLAGGEWVVTTSKDGTCRVWEVGE